MVGLEIFLSDLSWLFLCFYILDRGLGVELKIFLEMCVLFGCKTCA